MGSLFSSAEDDAPPAAWRLGGEREAIARRLGREEGGAVRWACRVAPTPRARAPRRPAHTRSRARAPAAAALDRDRMIEACSLRYQ